MKRITILLLGALLLLPGADRAESQDADVGELIGDLEKIIRDEKRKSNHDRDLVRRLESLLRKYRGRGGGAEDDSGSRGRDDGGSRGGGGGGGRWSPEGIIAQVLDDIDLSGEQREKATRILAEYYVSWTLVRTNSDLEKCKPELQRDRNNRLARAVGQKKAREIIDAVDSRLDRWERWGNRGGGRGR